VHTAANKVTSSMPTAHEDLKTADNKIYRQSYTRELFVGS